jgi:hypothetical protein
MDATFSYLRVAVRTLAKTPGFTATVVLTLALGIGANSAVFSAINAVLLKPLPFPDGDQLVSVLGCAAGLALALAFMRVLAGMLFGVSARDPATMSAVLGVMLAVAALASFLPAVRAARVEPMKVLREE